METGSRHDDQRDLLVGFGLAFFGYSALVLLLFQGLVGRFSTAVPHDLGDPLLSTWILWWNAHRLPFVGEWWDGMSFYPAQGSLAFSDHRVGLGLIAGPIQWLGGTPVLAYNVTLLATFVLSALAAHALTWTLTRSHAAGAVSGMIFGFSPYRISHVAHLELLAAWWIPLALIALHQYVRRFDVRWLGLFIALLTLQGLSSGYYLFYSAPVIGLWAVWFASERPWRGTAAVLLAVAVVVIVLLPVLLRYRTIQDQLHLSRGFAEMDYFSADMTGLLSATPIMALWRVPSLAQTGEGEIYLGIFAPLLLLAAVLWRGRTNDAPPERWHALRVGLALLSAVYALVAVGTIFGAWSVRLGPVTVSASRTERPLEVALILLLVLFLTSPTFVGAFRRRSAFAFYTLVAALTWLFTLGPRPKLLGHPLLYRGPYALLMLLPGFDDRLRVPARFVMITILAVAVAGGFALLRLTASASRTRRIVVTVLVVGAITLDSWTFACPNPPAPAFVPLPGGVPDRAAVLELPLGDVGLDIAATYRSIGHGHPVVNGYSGYVPSHYRVLRSGLEAHDDSVLTTLTRFAPIVVVIADERDPSGAWATYIERHDGARTLERAGGRTTYLLPVSRPDDESVFDARLPIARATSNFAGFDPQVVTDGNLRTAQATPAPQRGGEEVVLDLGGAHGLSGLSLSTGPPVEGFPRYLVVSASMDGRIWENVWSGETAGPALEGVLKDALGAPIRIVFRSTPARFLRLRQLRESTVPWVIAEIAVYGTSAPPGR